MKLKDIYALGGEPTFGPLARYQRFEKEWFERIAELQFSAQDLDEDALAGAGRLNATEIVSMCDDSGEYGSTVTMLSLDGKPFALHGTAGERTETRYLLVTDEALYQAAEDHVRSHLVPRRSTPYDVVSLEDDRSLEEMFGFYFQEMADAARVRVQEVFGEQAAPALGNESPERAEGYILTRAGNVIHHPTDDQRGLMMVGFEREGEPDVYLRRGAALLERQCLYEGPEVADWKASLTDILSWWLYAPVARAADGAAVTRV